MTVPSSNAHGAAETLSTAQSGELRPAVEAGEPTESRPAERPKTGVELLADPAKGKVFVGYFSLVKDRIHRKLVEKYGRAAGDRGSVALSFVLTPDGRVQRASVLQKESSADPSLRRLALDCLQEAAPFGGFPDEIASHPIAFTLTVYFDQI